MPFRRTILALCASALPWMALAARAAEDPLAQFEREVRPLLEQKCFECHGPDKQKGGIRLDQKASMLGTGDSEQPVVVPGQSGASLLVKRLLSTDPDEAMPPKGRRLEPAQIASVKQ